MDRAGLTVAHSDRVECSLGAGGQRPGAARGVRGLGVPHQRQHLRDAARELNRLRGRGLAGRRVPHHVTVLRHDHVHRAGAVRQRARGRRGRDGIDAECRPRALGVAWLAGDQAEHDVGGRARARRTAGRGRGRARMGCGGRRRCRRRRGRRGRLAWLKPRAPVGDRGQGLLLGKRGHRSACGGHLVRRRLMGTGDQPGARAERDDPAAEDKEPPPPAGPVIIRVPRLVT